MVIAVVSIVLALVTSVVAGLFAGGVDGDYSLVGDAVAAAATGIPAILMVLALAAALHALAAKHAVPSLTAEDLARMQEANSAFAQALARGDTPGALAADDAFHAIFVARAGNGELQRSLQRLLPRVRRL